MIRRPLWLAAGMAVGVGGTLWAERRVRRAVDRLSPDAVALEAGRSVRRLGDRVQAAVAAGREARERREEELWAELRGRTARPPARPGPDRTAPTRTAPHRAAPDRTAPHRAAPDRTGEARRPPGRARAAWGGAGPRR